MDSLQSKIQNDLLHAFKNHENLKVAALRLLQAAVHNAEIEKRKKETGLSDEEIVEVVGREIKKRKEAALLYRKGGRTELAEKEELEAKILEVYLPERLSEEELRRIVSAVMASGETNVGTVMGAVMAKVKGKADGTAVRKMVEEMLKNS